MIMGYPGSPFQWAHGVDSSFWKFDLKKSNILRTYFLAQREETAHFELLTTCNNVIFSVKAPPLSSHPTLQQFNHGNNDYLLLNKIERLRNRIQWHLMTRRRITIYIVSKCSSILRLGFKSLDCDGGGVRGFVGHIGQGHGGDCL